MTLERQRLQPLGGWIVVIAMVSGSVFGEELKKRKQPSVSRGAGALTEYAAKITLRKTVGSKEQIHLTNETIAKYAEQGLLTSVSVPENPVGSVEQGRNQSEELTGNAGRMLIGTERPGQENESDPVRSETEGRDSERGLEPDILKAEILRLEQEFYRNDNVDERDNVLRLRYGKLLREWEKQYGDLDPSTSPDGRKQRPEYD